MARQAETFKLTVQIDLKNKQQLQELIKQLNDAAAGASNVGATTTKVNKGLKKTQIQARQTGRAVQNFSYQLQDMIVQISGGVDPLRSMSQQLPQMLINMGALGGVIGVVAAGLPILIQAFKNSGAQAIDLNEAIGNLNVSMDTFSTKSFVDQMESATEAERKFLEQSLKGREQLARRAVDQKGESLTGPLSPLSSGQELPFEVAKVISNEIGLPLEVIVQNIKLLKDFEESGGNNIDLLQEMRELYLETSESQGFLNKTGRDYLDNLFQMEEGLVSVKNAQDGLNTSLKQGANQQGANRAIALNDYEQQQREFYDAALELERTYEEERAALRKKADAESARLQKEAMRRQQEALKILDDDILNALDYISKKSTEVSKLEEEHAKRRMELWKLAYPEVARYTEAVALLDEQLKENIITEDIAIKKRGEAKQSLDESLAGYSLLEDGIDIFQDSFNTMLDGVLMGTQNISDGFRDMAKVVIAQILKIIAYNAIFQAFGQSSGVLGVIGRSFNPENNADGNAFSNGNVIPFAKGGIVSSPTIFPMAKGAGLMGEAGPEAIMPLSRGADGKLGVSGGGVNVTINNLAPGVQVQQRETEQGLTIDIVMKSLSQAISQGGNDLSTAMEGTYSLGRGRSIY